MGNPRYARVVGLRLSETLMQRARRAAAARDQRLSELCRDAIREHVARLEQRGEVADGTNCTAR
jgi:predicted transcriptional regulator